jgi:hypothetical protein
MWVPLGSVDKNVVIEWLTQRIRAVTSSNLSPETGYIDRGFTWFSSVSPGECRDNTLKIRLRTFPSKPFEINDSLSTLSFNPI